MYACIIIILQKPYLYKIKVKTTSTKKINYDEIYCIKIGNSLLNSFFNIFIGMKISNVFVHTDIYRLELFGCGIIFQRHYILFYVYLSYSEHFHT